MDRNIWEGVYKTYEEIPVTGAGFDGDTWIKRSKEKLAETLAKAEKGGAIPDIVEYKTSLLPFLAGVKAGKKEKVRIVDFGGGLGITYLQVISAVVDKERIDYHIVENIKVCQEGRQQFSNYPRVHFHSTFPEDIRDVDIAHICSSLQYVKEWKSVISQICAYNAEHIVFADLPAGDIPTYATAQNYYESKIPFWFFNIDEIIGKMNEENYKLTFKASFAPTIHNKENVYPQDNFEKEYRLGKSCNLLFTKDDNMLDGVEIKKLVTHTDKRGFFQEIIRLTDDLFKEGFGQWSVSQMYHGVIKAWHVHQKQVDWWYVANGVLKVALYDTRKESPTYKNTQEIYMGDNQPTIVLRIPPGVAHGCKCLSGPANLFYITSNIYDPDDEGRIPYNDPEIGYDWLKGPEIK